MNKNTGRRERGNGSFVRNSGGELSESEIREIAQSIDSKITPEEIRQLQSAEGRQSWGKTFNEFECGPLIV